MRLRDKVAAMFDASGSSSSSDDAIDISSDTQIAPEIPLHDKEPGKQPSSPETRPATMPHSRQSALHALATPAPEKHPRPASHNFWNHQSYDQAPPIQSEMQKRELHVPLLMMRKGTLDGIVRRSASVPKNAISLLIAASSLVLPLDKLKWEHVKTLIMQRRYISLLSHAVLDVDSQSPILSIPRDYLSNNPTPPVFQASSEAAQGLVIIHNWLVVSVCLHEVELGACDYFSQVEYLSIVDSASMRLRLSDSASFENVHPRQSAPAVRFGNDTTLQTTYQPDADVTGGEENSLLSNYFGIWRVNSRQQFRMQMVRA